MKFAIYAPIFGPYADPQTLVNLACDVEQAGWDGFFIWDHIAMWWPGATPVGDPWITLSAIANATQRVRIGALVTPIPRRRPWKLARETVSLDRLSKGRLVFGAGIGLGSREFDDLGEESVLKERGAMLDEGLDILTGLWSGDKFSYNGKYYQVKEVIFRPTPLQKPRIPIWVGGSWPIKPPFLRAARWDGCFPMLRDDGPFDISVQQIKDMLTFIHKYRDREDPFDMIFPNGKPNEDPAEVIDRVGPYEEIGVTWWFEQLNPWRFGWDNQGEWPLEKMRERVLAGPPR